MAGKVFRGGVPTDVDVARLVSKFGVPSVGDLLPYDELAAVIQSPYRSARFASVFARWRKQMEGDGLYLKAQPDKRAYLVLDDAGKAERLHGHLRSVRRGVRRGLQVAGHTDRTKLSEVGQRKFDHAALNLGTMQQHDYVLARRKTVELPAAVR